MKLTVAQLRAMTFDELLNLCQEELDIFVYNDSTKGDLIQFIRDHQTADHGETCTGCASVHLY